jgi:hypothetical protein
MHLSGNSSPVSCRWLYAFGSKQLLCCSLARQWTTVSTVTSDILPALCKLAGTDVPQVPLDGIDLAPLLQGKMKQRGKPIAFWNFPVETSQGGKPYIDPELQKGTTPLVKQMRGSSPVIFAMSITRKLRKRTSTEHGRSFQATTN